MFLTDESTQSGVNSFVLRGNGRNLWKSSKISKASDMKPSRAMLR